MNIDDTLLKAGGVVAAVAAAWGTAKATLGVMVARVATLERSFTQHTQEDDAHHVAAIDRLARIETKLDMLLRRD